MMGTAYCAMVLCVLHDHCVAGENMRVWSRSDGEMLYRPLVEGYVSRPLSTGVAWYRGVWRGALCVLQIEK